MFVLRQKKKRFLFPLHRPSALPGWMMTRSSTMSINIVRLIKPVAMAYRNGSGTWQSKPSMAVFKRDGVTGQAALSRVEEVLKIGQNSMF